MMKEIKRTNIRTKAFGCIMLSLKEMNKIHTQTIVTQRITTKQQRQQQPSNHLQNRNYQAEQQATIRQMHKIDV